MASNDYDVYVGECIALTRSLVIKSEQTIHAINRYLQEVGHAVPEESDNGGTGWEDWKYYKNLNGEYYLDPDPPASGPRLGYDVPMTVTSLDTQATISFDKATLANHPLTLSEYKGFGRFYNELVDAYPEQQELIRRILNPVDPQVAYEAPDYTVLQYDSNYVDFNEYNLIQELQHWLYNFTGRFDTDAFGISHRYFAAAKVGILYTLIPPVIINIRLRNAKTPYAHSYHVWKYLGDYYGLDRFKNLIYHDQAMWLYRNIDELVERGGIRETLDFFKEEFAEPFGLHLKSLELEKDTSNLLDSLTHEAFITKHPYGTNPATYGTRSDVARVYDQLKNQALKNNVYQDEKEALVDEVLKRDRHNSFNTGIIEVDAEQEAQSGLSNYIVERFNQWFYLSGYGTEGSFLVKFNLEIPGQGNVLVSPDQAAAIVLYIGLRMVGDTSDNIPNIWVREIPFLDPGVDYEAMFYDAVESRFMWQDRVDFLLDGMADIKPKVIHTVEGFLEHVDAIVNKKSMLKLMIGGENDPQGKSQLSSAVDSMMVDALVQPVQQTTFSALFQFLQIELDFADPSDYRMLASQIVRHLVGNVQLNEGLSNPYFEMMQILRILSRYTTMFIPGRRNAYEIMDWPFLGTTREATWLAYDGHIEPPNIKHGVDVDELVYEPYEVDVTLDYMLSTHEQNDLTVVENGVEHESQQGVTYDHMVYQGGIQSGSPSTDIVYPEADPFVEMWFTETPPEGYVIADGREMDRVEAAHLFKLIGTKYGAGDGVNTFNIPDYRGTFARVYDEGSGIDVDSGTRVHPGDGTTGNTIGSFQDQAMRFHRHGVTVGSTVGGFWLPARLKGARIDRVAIRTEYNGAGDQLETRPVNIGVHYIVRYK